MIPGKHSEEYVHYPDISRYKKWLLICKADKTLAVVFFICSVVTISALVAFAIYYYKASDVNDPGYKPTKDDYSSRVTVPNQDDSQKDTGSNSAGDNTGGSSRSISDPVSEGIDPCQEVDGVSFCLPKACADSLNDLVVDKISVCGSVQQVYVEYAPAGSPVTLSGLHNYSGVTDSAGGLVIRNIQAGRYATEVNGKTYQVTVTTPTQHPSPSFYEEQVLSADVSGGYIKTRDST